MGGWVPGSGLVGGPVDSSADDLRSGPDPEWTSRPEGATGWMGNAGSDSVDEEADSGAGFDDPDSGSTDGHNGDDSPRRTAGEGDRDPDRNTDVRRRAVRAPRMGRQWGRFAELWIPEPLRDARVDPGRRGALILLLVAALAAVVTAVGVWRNQPEPVPVPMAASAATVVGPATGAGAPIGTPASRGPAPTEQTAATPVDASAVSEIVVSVTGLVGRAGLVTVPPGARVADAIAAAGGATADADLTGMNLAAKLTDGDSIVLSESPNGSSGPAGGAAPAATGRESPVGSGSALVNLNTADEATLDSLPGVGPVMAQNILAWRDANGSFSSIEQLQEISGIGPSRYAQISPLVTV